MYLIRTLWIFTPREPHTCSLQCSEMKKHCLFCPTSIRQSNNQPVIHMQYPFIHPSFHWVFHPSIHLFIHLSIYSFVYPSIQNHPPFIHPFIHPSVHSFIHPSVHPPIYQSIHSQYVKSPKSQKSSDYLISLKRNTVCLTLIPLLCNKH